MNVVGIIPARYDSVRLPGKPLMLIKGKTMIQRVYEQSRKSKLLDRVIVATDDRRILAAVENFGGECMMTSRNHSSGTDRICEVARKISCDIVVNIQGDEPFIHPGNIDKAVAPVIEDKRLNVSTLAVKMNPGKDSADPNKVKVVFDLEGNALYFSRSIIPFSFNENRMTGLYKHIGLYVYRKKFLFAFSRMSKSKLELSEKLEQLRILDNGERIRVIVTKRDSVSVDTIEDLNLLNSDIRI